MTERAAAPRTAEIRAEVVRSDEPLDFDAWASRLVEETLELERMPAEPTAARPSTAA